MSSALTEVENYDLTVIGPAGGDPRNASSVRTMGQGGANRAKWMITRLAELLGNYQAATGAASTDLISLASHGYSDNQPIRFYAIAGQTLPSPLAAGTVYFVFAIDANTFKVRTASGGSALNLTTDGGAFFVTNVPDALAALYAPTQDSAMLAGSIRAQIGDFVRKNGGTPQLIGNALTFTNGFISNFLSSFNSSIQLSGTDASILYRYVSQADASVTVDVNKDHFRLATPTAARTITVTTTSGSGLKGARLRFVRGAAGAFDWLIKRTDTTLICTLVASTWGWAEIVHNGTDWELGGMGGGTTAGAGA